MCRIFGQFGQDEIDEASLRLAAQTMKHGGPDRQNYEVGRYWALGNDRLAIQGVKGGDQPFTDQNGICVVFNGEIYNHQELRSSLQKKGFSFTDNCDGNVIAPLFRLYGHDFAKKLDGMFAIAIIDMRDRQALHLFTDPAAVKSVYYHWDDQRKTLRFASEVDGLGVLRQEPFVVDPGTVFDYLSLRAVCGEQTIFENIRTLGPSRHLYCELGKSPEVFIYKSSLLSPVPAPTLAGSGQQFRQMIDNEIRQLMSADVPVCVVTSGGLDSTLLSALAAKYATDLHSFHVCYKGNWPSDERNFAREAAQQFGTKHHEIEVDPDSFPDLILRMTPHMGQPNTAPHSLSTYCLFQGIHDAGFRVAITGEGSDELFAGYERFADALSPQNDWIPGYMDRFGPFPSRLREDVLAQSFLTSARQTTSRIEEFASRILRTEPGVERLNALQALDQWDRFPYYIFTPCRSLEYGPCS